MIFGIGCDVCALDHLEKSLSGPHAAAFVRRVYGPAECTALALDTPCPPGTAVPTGWPARQRILPPRRRS